MGEPIYNPEEVSEKFYKKPGGGAQNTPEQVQPKQNQQAKQFNQPANDEVFNLEEASDELPEIEPLPEGWYECEVETAEKTYSRNGKVMLALRFRVLEPIEFQNRTILWNIVPSTAFGLTRLKQFISRTGLSEKVNRANFHLQEFADSGLAIGATCKLHLKSQRFKRNDGSWANGNSVRDIAPSSGADFLANK